MVHHATQLTLLWVVCVLERSGLGVLERSGLCGLEPCLDAADWSCRPRPGLAGQIVVLVRASRRIAQPLTHVSNGREFSRPPDRLAEVCGTVLLLLSHISLYESRVLIERPSARIFKASGACFVYSGHQTAQSTVRLAPTDCPLDFVEGISQSMPGAIGIEVSWAVRAPHRSTTFGITRHASKPRRSCSAVLTCDYVANNQSAKPLLSRKNREECSGT